MTFNDVVEHARHTVRIYGFMSASQLSVEVISFIHENKDSFVESVECLNVLDNLKCDDIHSVEYTNSVVKDYRVKDLFYFNPGLKT